jgi:hemolysin III
MIKRLREPVSGLTHFFAAIAALIGTVALLVLGHNSWAKEAALGAYGVSLVLLFSASATYHMVRAGQRVTALLRKLDHAAIYLLIAGTYTPFCLLAFTGFWRWGLFAIIWSIAIIGIVTKMFLMHAPRWLSAGTYVVMGWLCVGAVGQMLHVLSPAVLAWLAAGGVTYTLGAIVYITKILDFVPGRFGFHEVWHIFVILGALAHFIAIISYVVQIRPGT